MSNEMNQWARLHKPTHWKRNANLWHISMVSIEKQTSNQNKKFNEEREKRTILKEKRGDEQKMLSTFYQMFQWE